MNAWAMSLEMILIHYFQIWCQASSTLVLIIVSLRWWWWMSDSSSSTSSLHTLFVIKQFALILWQLTDYRVKFTVWLLSNFIPLIIFVWNLHLLLIRSCVSMIIIINPNLNIMQKLKVVCLWLQLHVLSLLLLVLEWTRQTSLWLMMLLAVSLIRNNETVVGAYVLRLPIFSMIKRPRQTLLRLH